MEEEEGEGHLTCRFPKRTFIKATFHVYRHKQHEEHERDTETISHVYRSKQPEGH